MTVRRAREVTLPSDTADAPRRVMRGFSYSSHSFLGISLVVTQHSPLGRRAVPGSWVGGTCGSGGGYGVLPASVATHCATVMAVGTSVEGNDGTGPKKPPFSPYVANSTVVAHARGFAVRAWLIVERSFAPKIDGAGGCSLSTRGASTHDTCGSVPASASAANPTG